MRKVNIDELTRKLNTFRMEHLNDTFMSYDLRVSLYHLGFNQNIVSELIKVFPCENIGGKKLYGVPQDPVFKDKVKQLYEDRREVEKHRHLRKKGGEVEISEEDALSVLQAKGYQIKKPVGFDANLFQKENPEMYQKYLLYETVL